MKKNRMLRTASAMLILTIITISVIGGALAKYTTEATGSDTAVVAKFGVTATVSGDLFGKIYSTDDTKVKDTIPNSVNGQTVDVIAPGTENKTGMSLSVTGTPEVAATVTLGEMKGADNKVYKNSDIYLAQGEYGVMVPYTGEIDNIAAGDFYKLGSGTYTKLTEAPTDDTQVYQLQQRAKVETADYYPLKWFVNDGTNETLCNNTDEIVTKLSGIFGDKGLTPNVSCSLPTVKVGWVWPFDDATNSGTNDGEDTILGNMIAKQMSAAGAPDVVWIDTDNDSIVTVEYKLEDAATSSANQVVNAYANNVKVACLTAAFNVSLTVTQVD